jgi:hypothetical protein
MLFQHVSLCDYLWEVEEKLLRGRLPKVKEIITACCESRDKQKVQLVHVITRTFLLREIPEAPRIVLETSLNELYYEEMDWIQPLRILGGVNSFRF